MTYTKEKMCAGSDWLSKIVEGVSNEDLCIMIEEISEFRNTGIISKRTNELRMVRQQMVNICNVDYSETMRTVEDAILFESARRYYNYINH